MAEEKDIFEVLSSQIVLQQNEELNLLKANGEKENSELWTRTIARYQEELKTINNVASAYSQFVSANTEELMATNPGAVQEFLEIAKTNAEKATFYYGFKDLGASLDISKRINGVALAFGSLPNQQQTSIRERLGKHFNAQGFEGMSRQEVLIFFDQFQKGNLVVNTSPENLQKMAHMLAIMPKSKSSGNMTISHRKFNLALNFNRRRKQRSLNKAAKELLSVQQKYQKQLAKLEQKFKGERKHLYEMTEDDFLTKSVNGNYFSHRWYKFANWGAKTLRLTREAEEQSIAKLENKILGSSAWNPLHWPQRLALKALQGRKTQQEKKSIAHMSLQKLAETEDALKKQIEALSQTIELGGDVQKISQLQKEKNTKVLLLAEATRVRAIKQKNYETEKKLLAQKFAAEAKPFEQRVAERYKLINEKTDFIDYSTPTGKFLYAVLQKAPGTQKKQLEALVLTRKQQKFGSEDEFIQFVTDQLQYSGHSKTDRTDLMAVIAKAVAKEEGINLGNQAPTNDENPDNLADENIGENVGTDRVHEGHGNQTPAPDPNWQQQSEQELQNSYEASAYELVSPQREGPHADDENVLYQTFKSKEDDHTVTVERPTANDYNLSAKDKDGKDTVPSVDDMKAVMESIKKSGHTTMELGEIKSPEFLARAVAAAEESGIEITNLKEVKERLSNSMGQEQFEQRYGQDQKRETERRQAEAIERSGFTKDLNVKEGTKVDKTVRGLNALAAVSQMSYQEYEEYKKTDEFKSQKLTKNQIKILDGIKKLQQEEKEGKITSKDRRYIRTLSQMIEDYQAIGNRYSDKGKKEVAQKAFARGVVQRASMQQRQGGR